jgi:ABC-type dipeptide/oligopeptide/nickel transport system permease component
MKRILSFLLVLLMVTLPVFCLAEAVATPAPVQTYIDLTSFAEVVITVLMALITTFVIPWLKQKKLLNYAHIAVFAAEKLLGPKMGPEKLKQVKTFMQQWGFDIDDSKVLMAIEAAVQQLSLQQVQQALPATTVEKIDITGAYNHDEDNS